MDYDDQSSSLGPLLEPDYMYGLGSVAGSCRPAYAGDLEVDAE